MTLAVLVNGRPLGEYGLYSPPTYTTLADGGFGPASWEMSTRMPAGRWRALRGASACITHGGVPLWWGTIKTPDPTTGRVECVGDFEVAEKVPAVTAAGLVSATVADVVAGAQGRGWKAAGTLTGTITGGVEEPMMVAEFLQLLANQTGKRVGVDGPERHLYLREDPTHPSLHLSTRDIHPRVVESTNTLMGRYRDAGGVIRTITRPASLTVLPSSDIVDLTALRKELTGAEAASILDQMLALTTDRPRWAEPLEVPLRQITTLGGAPITSPASVRAGQMIRFPLLSAAAQIEVGTDHLNEVLGSVTYTAATGMLRLEAVDSDVMTVAEAFEAVSSR